MVLEVKGERLDLSVRADPKIILEEEKVKHRQKNHGRATENKGTFYSLPAEKALQRRHKSQKPYGEIWFYLAT